MKAERMLWSNAAVGQWWSHQRFSLYTSLPAERAAFIEFDDCAAVRSDLSQILRQMEKEHTETRIHKIRIRVRARR